MSELIGSLSCINRWKDTQGKETALKEAISHFISECVKLKQPLESVEEQLLRLHSEELIISEKLLETAQKMAADEYNVSNPSPDPGPSMATKSLVNTTDEEVDPLFCKDTIYHACMCSHAVSIYSAGDYQTFFKNKNKDPLGHSFKAVSFSRSKDNSFLIAQKGESTFYFAFKGRLSLSDWAKDYKSFNEGKSIIIRCIIIIYSVTIIMSCY